MKKAKRFTAFLMAASIILAFLLIIFLTGCGKEVEEVKDIPQEKQVEVVKSDFEMLLDDFEKYLDEYCTFIEEYSKAEPSEQMTMASEYMRIATEYMEIAEKVQAIDTDELSTDEAAYYLEVMGRCGARMVQVQGNMDAENE